MKLNTTFLLKCHREAQVNGYKDYHQKFCAGYKDDIYTKNIFQGPVCVYIQERENTFI